MSQTVDELANLPTGLNADDLRVTLAEIGDLGEWPVGSDFVEAQQPAALSRHIRKAFHPELESARIAHLFKNKMGGQGCRVVARAKRASKELAFLADVDFVITYSWSAWSGLILWQKLALVDHELSHCGRDPDLGWITLPHDVEEFHAIARRWGDWQPGLTMLRRQIELFERGPERTRRDP